MDKVQLLGKGGFGKSLKDKILRLLVPLLVADLTSALAAGLP